MNTWNAPQECSGCTNIIQTVNGAWCSFSRALIEYRNQAPCDDPED